MRPGKRSLLCDSFSSSICSLGTEHKKGYTFKTKFYTAVLIQIFETQKWSRHPGLLIAIPNLRLWLEFFFIGSMHVIDGRAGHMYIVQYIPCTMQTKNRGSSMYVCTIQLCVDDCFNSCFNSPSVFWVRFAGYKYVSCLTHARETRFIIRTRREKSFCLSRYVCSTPPLHICSYYLSIYLAIKLAFLKPPALVFQKKEKKKIIIIIANLNHQLV